MKKPPDKLFYTNIYLSDLFIDYLYNINDKYH